MFLLGIPTVGVQNYEDFKKDFETGKVKCQSIHQTELKELKIKNKFANVRRIIAVKGLYKNDEFEMKLSVLEFWIRQKESGNCGAGKVLV